MRDNQELLQGRKDRPSEKNTVTKSVKNSSLLVQATLQN